MRGNEIPIDFVSKQCIKMVVTDRLVGPIENRVADAAHAWHQLDAKEPTQAEDRLVLTLRICMKRVRLDRRAVLHQRVQDMDRLPDTAGNEAGEQGDIG